MAERATAEGTSRGPGHEFALFRVLEQEEDRGGVFLKTPRTLRTPCWDGAAGGTCSARAGASCPPTPAAPARRGPARVPWRPPTLGSESRLRLGSAPQPLQILASILNGQE